MLGGRFTLRGVTATVATLTVAGLMGAATPAGALLLVHTTTGTGTTLNGNVCESITGVTARFNDSAPSAVTDFSASIDWGDGTAPTNGTVALVAPQAFSVSGSHVYAKHGRMVVTTTIAGPAGSSLVVNGAANVAGSAVRGLSGLPVASPIEGHHLSARLARFDDVVCAQQTDFTATVDWGDGSPATTGTPANFVTPTSTHEDDDDDGPSLPRTGFEVLGDHTYERQGTYTVTVEVHSIRNETAAATTTIRVLDAAIFASPGAAPLNNGVEPGFISGGTASSGELARFTTDSSFGQRSDFSVSVAWGDGQTSGAVIDGPTGPSSGPWTISGTHQYAEDGTYVITVTIRSSSGSTATVQTSAQVAEPSNPIDLVLDKILG